MSIQHFDRATAVLVDKLLTTRFHYSFEILIEHAGMAVAQAALRQLHSPLAKVLVLAGPGNNGADAMAAARFLKL
jgi:NAD(P)H-hydrate repair Nnr-like enzyme with NAD(P)H-hydrate epimerase domain